MGLFDGLTQYLSDPQNAARLRGALISGAQAAAQPYGNLGSISAAFGAGGQTGVQNYQTNQANQLSLANDRFGMQQKLAPVNFMRNLQGQQPLTLDDIMKGNFGGQVPPSQAPMSPPPMAKPSIDPGFTAGVGGPNVDPGFSPPKPPGPNIDPGFSPAPMGAPQMAATAPVGALGVSPALAPTPSPKIAPQPQQVPQVPSQAPAPAPQSQTTAGGAAQNPRPDLIPDSVWASPLFQTALKSGDQTTVMSMLTKHQVQLTPQELKDANLPSDSLAFRNPLDGTIDIKRTGTIQSPEEVAAATQAEQAKGLKSPAEIQQELSLHQREAGMVAPSVENSILLPLLRKQLSGQTLTPQEQGVLSIVKPTALVGPQGLQPTDAKSGSIQGQTGLSQAAINALTQGQYPRGTAAFNAINKEIDDFARKNGINTVTLKAQAKGYNDVLTNNIQRNNQGQILENEIQGSVQNVAPLADAIGQGKISVGNLTNVWAGKQVNDPTVLQYKDQLIRLQHELAAYNVVAGGQLNENGSVRGVEKGDLDNAADIISKGINSGGLQGLSRSIGASTVKNKAVLGSAIDDANQGMWNLFGVGHNYQRQSPPVSGTGSPSPSKPWPAPPPQAIQALKMKKDKSNFDAIFGPGAADRALNGK